MNFRIIGIIIRREYLNKVKKKSFLITTFVVPVLMAALCIVPILLMMNSKDKIKKIAVVDQSGIVMPMMENSETLHYSDFSAFNVDSVKSMMKEFGLDAVLGISPLDEATKAVTANLTSPKPLGIEAVESIGRKVNSAVEAYRIESYDIAGLEQILQDVKADIKLNTFTLDEDGKETVTETGVFVALSMGLGILLFLFIALFGGMVMSAVIEEKSSRVVEVLISSVKATELMFGKIFGIALVALTQFVLWIVLTLVLVSAAGTFLGPELKDQLTAAQQLTSAVGGTNYAAGITEVAEAAQAAGAADLTEAAEAAATEAAQAAGAADLTKATEAAEAAAEPSELSVIVSTLANLPYGQIAVVFFLFFFFGYVLYASMYAAVGSAVENEGDTQQLQMPITIPLMLGYFIAIYSFNAPDSAIAFWGSMIPFTSPIVMLARLPFGVETWEIAVSVGILIATTCLMAWLSAKIYKVGILIFGKKSTWKDLWKWLRQN